MLPPTDNDGQRIATSAFDALQKELARAFGGVTACVRSPAVGLWKEGGNQLDKEEVVVFEVLAEQLDKKWWAEYRKTLETRFDQEDFVYAMLAERL